MTSPRTVRLLEVARRECAANPARRIRPVSLTASLQRGIKRDLARLPSGDDPGAARSIERLRGQVLRALDRLSSRLAENGVREYLWSSGLPEVTFKAILAAGNHCWADAEFLGWMVEGELLARGFTGGEAEAVAGAVVTASEGSRRLDQPWRAIVLARFATPAGAEDDVGAATRPGEEPSFERLGRTIERRLQQSRLAFSRGEEALLLQAIALEENRTGCARREAVDLVLATALRREGERMVRGRNRSLSFGPSDHAVVSGEKPHEQLTTGALLGEIEHLASLDGMQISGAVETVVAEKFGFAEMGGGHSRPAFPRDQEGVALLYRQARVNQAGRLLRAGLLDQHRTVEVLSVEDFAGCQVPERGHSCCHASRDPASLTRTPARPPRW
jgi:hypothetical protein